MISESITALLSERYRWLVTGAAGFIGSNLVEALLMAGQEVVGLDDFSSGHLRNLELVREVVATHIDDFSLVRGDIRDRTACLNAMRGVDFVLHHAAVASVPLSIEQPALVHEINVAGTVCVFEAARACGVRRVVYASSSAVYGDLQALPQMEEEIGRPLSPYGATKRINEIDGDLYSNVFGLETLGLRYFNVFGPRQDPKGAYAAVIPRWIESVVRKEPLTVYGQFGISRDFCFIGDVVRANVTAAVRPGVIGGQVFNIASGRETTLGSLFDAIRDTARKQGIAYDLEPRIEPARAGDIERSVAAVEKARAVLGFVAEKQLEEGLGPTVSYYSRAVGRS